MFAGFMTAELALHHVLWQVIATLGFVWAGALDYWPGQLGLTITFVSWAGLVYDYFAHSHDIDDLMEASLQRGLGEDYRAAILPSLGVPLRTGKIPTALPVVYHPDVEVIKGVKYAREGAIDLKVDILRHRSAPSNAPTLLQLHGGAWVIGFKERQAQPLMHQLAAQGWVCVNASYRLSPHATWPDHLLDAKKALRWIRQHGAEYGANPDFVVATGGSAGAHLASLLALTANDPEYQAGWEQVDTTIQGCVPIYGIYDMINRYGAMREESNFTKFLEQNVMKGSYEEMPKEYEKASPICRVHENAPPFFVIHGNFDTLTDVEGARRFVTKMRERSKAPVLYAEIPRAQHAFDISPSLRTRAVVNGIERFAAYLYSQYRMKADS